MRARWLVAAIFSLAASSHAAGVQVQPGDIILVRHATAPGVGDPRDFKLDDCATQRNLSEEGRAQAREFGQALQRRGVRVGAVLSSQWCRTRETAALAFPSMQVRDEPAFNSWFGQVPVESEAQVQRAREVLRQWKGPGVLVVVSHQVNIQAITGLPTASAGAVVMRRNATGDIGVVGPLAP
jgi:phosphohistidine phosphatase SixA